MLAFYCRASKPAKIHLLLALVECTPRDQEVVGSNLAELSSHSIHHLSDVSLFDFPEHDAR